MSVNIIVTDGELEILANRQHELFTRVKKGVLPITQVLDALQRVIEGKEPVIPTKTVIEHIIDLDADPFVPNDWTVDEHRKGGLFKWNTTRLVLYLSKNQQGGKVIGGKVFREELSKKPVANANLLDYLIKPENQHLIPEDWKKDENGNTRYIFFWGTIYSDSHNHFYIRYLYWSGCEWVSRCAWFEHNWDGVSPALLLKN